MYRKRVGSEGRSLRRSLLPGEEREEAEGGREGGWREEEREEMEAALLGRDKLGGESSLR